MAEWQPIETAPKDGTRILLYFPVLPKHYDQQSKISVGLSVNRGWWVTALGAGGLYDGETRPTHWTPLPEPPENNQ